MTESTRGQGLNAESWQIRAERVSLSPRLFTSAPSASDLPAYYLVKDLSFGVRAGDRLAIVGASGAGKTSLLRLLNRLSEPTRGTLYWQERPYTTIPVMQLRQQIVLVLQESKLLGMTVQDALAYPLRLRGLSKQAIQQRVGEWSDRLHIPSNWFDRTELQLSVGQRQLVAIARALATQPQVLLLDEPTSALDVGRSEVVLSVLADLTRSGSLTVLMVTHQLDLAQQFCHRLLHLQEGMVQQDCPVDRVDWAALRTSLITAEQQQQEEWT
ncbi:ABC transporter ATP-binding protein [Pantanalinema rosaneae CENA516]|uniref:ABC transporter ATP-binding protein n=1 Tax=Pantanalinema rosaneae TaxID=1620701 RepID=UPI003D6EA463